MAQNQNDPTPVLTWTPRPNNLQFFFPNFLTTDSLFQKMSSLGAPWTISIGKEMDDAYFTMYSGIKNPSGFVLQHQSDNIANSQVIASLLWSLHSEPWKRLWDAYQTQYNPINNYNLDETIKRDTNTDRNIGRDLDYTSTVDGTQKQTSEADSNGTSALQHGENIQTSDTINMFNHGFNSTTQIPTNDQVENGTENHTGTDTTTTTDHSTGEVDIATNDVREDKTAESTTDTTDVDETITRNRIGNIGQHSYQDLLRKEFELWKWNFFFRVFQDCDKFLTLSYVSCY